MHEIPVRNTKAILSCKLICKLIITLALSLLKEAWEVYCKNSPFFKRKYYPFLSNPVSLKRCQVPNIQLKKEKYTSYSSIINDIYKSKQKG